MENGDVERPSKSESWITPELSCAVGKYIHMRLPSPPAFGRIGCMVESPAVLFPPIGERSTLEELLMIASPG